MLTVKELKKVLDTMPDDAKVYACVEGYTNYSEELEDDTVAFIHKGNLFISDSCKVEELVEEPEVTPFQENLEMLLAVEFNRPVTKNDHVSFGSIYMEIGDQEIQFDFDRHVMFIDDAIPNVKNCCEKNLDFKTFSDCYKLSEETIENITKVTEIYLNMDEDSDLVPIKVKSLVFSSTYGIDDESKWKKVAVEEECLTDVSFVSS